MQDHVDSDLYSNPVMDHSGSVVSLLIWWHLRLPQVESRKKIGDLLRFWMRYSDLANRSTRDYTDPSVHVKIVQIRDLRFRSTLQSNLLAKQHPALMNSFICPNIKNLQWVYQNHLLRRVMKFFMLNIDTLNTVRHRNTFMTSNFNIKRSLTMENRFHLLQTLPLGLFHKEPD